MPDQMTATWRANDVIYGEGSDDLESLIGPGDLHHLTGRIEAAIRAAEEAAKRAVVEELLETLQAYSPQVAADVRVLWAERGER